MPTTLNCSLPLQTSVSGKQGLDVGRERAGVLGGWEGGGCDSDFAYREEELFMLDKFL